jgi:hypothetical protein
MTDRRVNEIVKECARQEESCRYTAAGLYLWQKNARRTKNIFVAAPIILGGLASSHILADLPEPWTRYVAALFAVLAGFFPAIFVALGLDMRVREIGAAAGEFTNLRDRFRQLGNIGADMDFCELNPIFEQLMDRMDAIRKAAPPLPEAFFNKGRQKITAGHYDFDVDRS